MVKQVKFISIITFLLTNLSSVYAAKTVGCLQDNDCPGSLLCNAQTGACERCPQGRLPKLPGSQTESCEKCAADTADQLNCSLCSLARVVHWKTLLPGAVQCYCSGKEVKLCTKRDANKEGKIVVDMELTCGKCP